jgi:outer membrane protein assembly factor BamB
MVPACAKERVFFGADRGQFFALDLRSGRKLWQAQADAFGAAAPVVVEKRVFVADERGLPWNGAPSTGQRLHAFDVGQGWQAWEEPYGQPPFSSLGIGERGRTAVAGLGTELVRLELASGKQREHLSIPLGTGAIAPAIVGQSLVFGTRDGRLCVHALEGDELRWAFQLPAGAAVQDFVHTGSRIYLATSIGLFCLADDPTRAAVAAGFVLEWKGDPREPSVVDEEPR